MRRRPTSPRSATAAAIRIYPLPLTSPPSPVAFTDREVESSAVLDPRRAASVSSPRLRPCPPQGSAASMFPRPKARADDGGRDEGARVGRRCRPRPHLLHNRARARVGRRCVPPREEPVGGTERKHPHAAVWFQDGCEQHSRGPRPPANSR